MSLINDALKQAEKDKRRNSGDAFDPPALEPVADRSAKRAGSGGRTLLVLLLLAFAGAAGWAIYAKIAAGNVPPTASAGVVPARKASRAPGVENSYTAKPQAVTSGEPVEIPAAKPQAERTGNSPTAKPQAERAEKAIAADADVELAFAKTLDAIRYYQPPSPQAAGNTSSPDSPAGGEAARSTPKPADAKPPKADPPRFMVSAIISSPRGANAIVNGVLVGVGGTVGGAKVIGITQTAVELELDGKRLTVGL